MIRSQVAFFASRPSKARQAARPSALALVLAALTGAGFTASLTLSSAHATEVVQALPDPNVERLSQALTRLGYDKNDLDALLDAGNAARELGDFDAARGFFERAEAVAPRDPRIMLGRARTDLLAGDPVAALGWYAKAERAGGLSGASAQASSVSDNGLALDMVGDNAGAQARYAQALAGVKVDSPQEAEVRQRLAVSQAISGDLQASEATLMPLLRKQDKPAWRTRAFTLAIAGQTREAIKLAETILPDPLGTQVAPYLRYMPRLTRAQQSEAANLGRFPRASQIGHDSAKIAAYTPARTAAERGLIPQGEALGAGSARASKVKKASARSSGRKDSAKKEDARKARAAQSEERIAPPDPKPGIEQASGAASAASSAQAIQLEPSGELPPVSRSAQSAPVAAWPKPVPASAPPAKPEPSVSQAFADLGAPRPADTRQSGAVDMRTITPRRPEKAVEKPAPAPKKPAHPSRIWLQIGVSRDTAAIAFEWHRYERRYPELFKGREAHISKMGQTNRILVGPFPSRKEVSAFKDAFTKASNSSALVWTSPAGQIVYTLESKD